jgi:hypothetical protein
VRVSLFLAWSVVVNALMTTFGVISAPLLLILVADTIVGVLIVRDCLALRHAAGAHNQGND